MIIHTLCAVLFGVLLSWAAGSILSAWIRACPRRTAAVAAGALESWGAHAEVQYIRLHLADVPTPVEVPVCDLVATLVLYAQGKHHPTPVTPP